jgi:hypothetical protein
MYTEMIKLGKSCSNMQMKNIYRALEGLPELPLAVRVTHCDAFSFFDVLVLDCREEAVEEAGGE